MSEGHLGGGWIHTPRVDRQRLFTALRLLGVYALVRIGLLCADVLAAHLDYGGHLGGPLRSWDAQHYLEVAAQGYPRVAPMLDGHLTYSNTAFEPVFPFLIRVVALLGFSETVAGLVVSILAGALAVLLVWRLGAVIFDEMVGWNAALCFAAFPGMAVVWGLLYSECVGIALAALCLYLLMGERWVWAGLAGALATATSPMALPLAVAALVPVAQGARRRRASPAIASVVLIPTRSTGGISNTRPGDSRWTSGGR